MSRFSGFTYSLKTCNVVIFHFVFSISRLVKKENEMALQRAEMRKIAWMYSLGQLLVHKYVPCCPAHSLFEVLLF